MKIKWKDKASAPVGRAYHTAVLCDGKIYIGGGNEPSLGSTYGSGSYTIDVYNLVNNSWSSSPINTTYCLFAMTTLNNQLVTAGGYDKNHKITNKIFSLDGNCLKEYTRMNTPRYDAIAAGHQGTLIITGGVNDQSKIIATTELFNSSSEQWYVTSDLSQPHTSLHSVVVDNTIYLLGGYSQDGKTSQTVFTAPLDTLSTNTLQWSSLQDTPSYSSAPVSIQGKHLLTVGGVKTDRTHDIHMFNKVSNSWEVIGQIPFAREGPAAVRVADNKIIIIGGLDDEGYTKTVWIAACETQ